MIWSIRSDYILEHACHACRKRILPSCKGPWMRVVTPASRMP